MDLLGTMVNAAVVAAVGAVIVWFTKGRFEAVERSIDRVETRLVGTEARLDGRIDEVGARLDGMGAGLSGRIDEVGARLDGMGAGLSGRIDEVGARVDGRFERLETRLERRFDTLQSSMDAMRSDLTQVALAVGVRPRAESD